MLTSRFIALLQTSPTGVLDLQEAAQALKLGAPGNAHTRRMYDITNVLEGVGIIEKASKKSIQWKGAGRGPQLKEEEIINKVGGRFKLSTLIQKRIVQLKQGSRVLIDTKGSDDQMRIVLQEILQDKIFLDENDEIQVAPDAEPVTDVPDINPLDL